MEEEKIILLKASGKRTADGTDQVITIEDFENNATHDMDNFFHIILDCLDCTAEMTFTIDEPIAGAKKPIYIKAGGGLDEYIFGKELHFSGAGVFRFILL
jgi:hypothetical protein